MTSNDVIHSFLLRTKQDYGGDYSSVEACHADMSTRKFHRVHYQNDSTAILMVAPPDDHPDSLPGHKIKDYLNIGRQLLELGFSVPEIFAADEGQGLVLMEDFGSETMKSQVESQPELYNIAAEALQQLSKVTINHLPDYYKSHVHKGRRRIIDWYVPAVLNETNPDGLVEKYLSVWDDIESHFEACPTSFIHVDFFPGNLVFLPDRSGINRCGILDFQGAMTGPAVYDIANLLEDARSYVPHEIRAQAITKFLGSKQDKELLKSWYRILATQYHCRVIGQFLKLAIAFNRKEYLEFMPIVHQHLMDGLEDPLLKPLKQFLSDIMPLDDLPELDVEKIKKVIRSDAY